MLKSVPDSARTKIMQKSHKYSQSKLERIRTLYGIRSSIPFHIDSHLGSSKFEKKLTKKFKPEKLNKSVIKEKGESQGETTEVELPKPFHMRLIISPDVRWKSVFDIWVLLFVGYSCIWNILVFAYTFTPNTSLDYFNLVIEFVFVLDFFLTFF